jgi:hypothetical protein
MPNYQESKIYKIINTELPNLIYYGSTTLKLKYRLSSHNCDSKRYNISSKIMFSVGYPEIILLEEYPCETKEELEARERVWIEGNECVNNNIPGRTDKEYYEDNKEKIKQYYQDNKEKFNEKNKQYRQDNKEKILENQKQHYQDNKKEMLEYRKQNYQDNKEKLNEKFDCVCGGKYTHQNKPLHTKTKKHIKFISSNQSCVDVVDGHQN